MSSCSGSAECALRTTIAQTFEELLRFVQTLDQEENRAVQEGLDEETLAIFDLLKKPELNAGEIKAINTTADHYLTASLRFV